MTYDFLPKLQHEIVYQLCLSEIDMDKAVMTSILSLPRAELIADIDLLLKCFLEDPEQLSEKLDSKGEEFELLIHCMYFLGELSATELLPTVLKIMECDEDTIDFWLGEFYGWDWGRQLVHLYKDDLDLFFAWLKKPNKYSTSRALGIASLVHLFEYYPEKKIEIESHLDGLIDYLLKTSSIKEGFDLRAFTFLTMTTGEFRGETFKDTAIELYRQGKYDPDFDLPFNEFLQELDEPPSQIQHSPKPSISYNYALHLKRFSGMEEDHNDSIETDFLLDNSSQSLQEVEGFMTVILPEIKLLELKWLYKYNVEIDPAKIKSILELPRAQLISDLELILKDYTQRAPLMEDYEEKYLPFWVPFHALHFLAELKSKESTPVIFKFLSLEDEFLMDCFDQYLFHDAWQLLDDLYIDNHQEFENFVLSPEASLQGIAAVLQMLRERHVRFPKEQSAVIKTFDRFIDHHDFECRAESYVQQLFRSVFLKILIEIRVPAYYSIARMLLRRSSNYRRLNMSKEEYIRLWHNESIEFIPLSKIFSIYDRYRFVANFESEDGFQERHLDLNQSTEGEITQVKSEKISRNAPCPCGSGKKWKRCCGQ